jgi:hypothetical protein
MNMKFTLRYNETFPEKVTLSGSPASPYDSMYLLGYAAYVVGDQPITGSSLARSIPRLLPPGKDVEVGPGPILDAFATLRSGQNVDLRGVQTSLDFDTATGEAPGDLVVQCVSADASGAAFDGVESGVSYDAKSRRLIGALKCP